MTLTHVKFRECKCGVRYRIRFSTDDTKWEYKIIGDKSDDPKSILCDTNEVKGGE